MMGNRRFRRTIGIDYSGAETAEASLKGLRVYQTLGDSVAEEVLPPAGPKKYWTRHSLADWLIETLDGSVPTVVGIDHGFSFPIRYFERHGLEPDWPNFLDDFCAHWPTDGKHTYVDFVRDGSVGNGAARQGERHWRRLTEEAAGSAKSVFHFDVQGTVAKSTHAGIPWLRKIRQARPQIHFWPFDGWEPVQDASVILEAYPRLWSSLYGSEARTQDQHDAYAIARWLQEAGISGEIKQAFAPPQPESVAMTAQVEGWILGTTWPPTDKPRARPKSESPRRSSTTATGYVNRNSQEVLSRTGQPGTDHNQIVYILQCRHCGARYGANGSDVFQRRCPECGDGRPGIPTG